MRTTSLILLTFLTSCASVFIKSPKEGKTTYSFTDVSGQYQYIRENKTLDKKIITRTQLVPPGGSKILEKSVTVSQQGTIKTGRGKRTLTVRPLASEFTVWLEGKKYFSRMKLDTKSKSMTVMMESPEAKWKGTKSIPFPDGQHFCFYSQLADCLFHNQFLSRSLSNENQSYGFYVVWEGYPYIQDQLTGIGGQLFSSATLKYDGQNKSLYRYILEVDGQTILYQFTKSFDLAKISWIAQGITVVPLGEEEANFEE